MSEYSIGNKKQRIVLVFKYLYKYRIPFVLQLRDYFKDKNIILDCIYSHPLPEDRERNDTGDIEWGKVVELQPLPVGKRALYWQPCLRQLPRADLIVVEQASKFILNYLLLVWQSIGGPKLGFWGHGRNLKKYDVSRTGEAVKRRYSTMAHWWFAYTNGAAKTVEELGFPAERITVFQNAIDTRPLMEARSRMDASQLAEIRAALAIKGDNVGLFSGSLYKEKRPAFLLEAAYEIRRLIPDFELIVMGGGPLQEIVETAARRHDWIHYISPQFGVEKVPYFMLAKVMLLPAAVGLAVLDSFALGKPLITVEHADHGPEIEYLSHERNGLLLPKSASPGTYASEVSKLLRDEARLRRMSRCAETDAERYSMQAMVERFGRGAIQALASANSSKSQ